MTTMPQPGDFSASGLPHHQDVFNAWLFLQANNTAQPPMYRDGFGVALAKTLLDSGERRPQILAAGLLAIMPPALNNLIRRRVSADCAATVQEFARHAMTRYAYIDFASPDVKKITMAVMQANMTQMEKHGEQTLERLRKFERDDQATIDIAVPMLPDQRSFLLIYDKVSDTTGNAQLENTYLDAALSYSAYRNDYLRQLSTMRTLPARLHQAVAQQLQENPPAPLFEATLLLDTPEIRAIYEQLRLDPRVNAEQLQDAVGIAEILSDSGDCAPVTVAAALLGTCLPHINSADTQFLRDIAGDDTLDIITDNAEAARAQLPVDQAPAPLQHITLARAILAMREGEQVAARLCEQLDIHASDLSAQDRSRYAAQTTQAIGHDLQEIIETLQPHAHDMSAPALAGALDSQIRRTFEELKRLRDFVSPEDRAKAQRPRREGPSF